MKSPFFSIIIPCFNAQSLIPRAIKSLNLQSFQDFEVLIVVDDLSKDYFLYEDERTKIVTSGRYGAGAGLARNLGFEQSSGAYIVMLDADDELSVDYLRLFHDFFIANPEPIAIAPTKVVSPTENFTLGNDLERITVAQFGWQLGSMHVVIHRSHHIEWQNHFAEDILRDGLLIQKFLSVSVLREAKYILHLHENQSTAPPKVCESAIRQNYRELSIKYTNEPVSQVFQIFEFANKVYVQFRSPQQSWYQFFSQFNGSEIDKRLTT